MICQYGDTICAPATVAGTGAISIVRISGPEALRIADKVVTFRKGTASDTPGGRVKFGIIHKDGDKGILDEVICCIYRAPHSYTGEDSVEIMCHASRYITDETLRLCLACGCRMAEPGEFTKRAFLAGKMDLAQAEAVADLIAASSEASHKVAVSQLKGGMSSQLASLRGQLLKMVSLLELELDFSEEDVEFADRKELVALLDETIGRIREMAGTFRLGNAMKNGVPVTIAGAANTGKSTLLNAILGEDRAIVSDIAGTTRDTVEECRNIGGVLFRFIDTAGIRGQVQEMDSEIEAGDKLAERDCRIDEIERIGISRSLYSLKKADIVIAVIDATEFVEDTGTAGEDDNSYQTDAMVAMHRIKSIDTNVPRAKKNSITPNAGLCPPSLESLITVLKQIDPSSQKLIIAVNKADLCQDLRCNKKVIIRNISVSLSDKQIVKCDYLIEQIKENDIFIISAKTGDGVEQMLEFLAETQKNRLNETDSECDATVTNLRHFEALTLTGKELAEARNNLLRDSPADLVAEDLREAISTLGTITGEITTDDILEEIFGKFCIGK